MNKKILIVDDEENIRTLLRFNLERDDYSVTEAETGTEALALARQNDYALLLLDIMLPELDGLEVCRQLKSNPATASLPIIMLTAKADEVDKVLGLELGADDYMVKPFAPRELLARMKAVLRRVQPQATTPAERIQLGPLSIDCRSYVAYNGTTQLALTPKEFELLKLFATHPNQAFSREALLAQVWGFDYLGDSRTVDVHIRHLRAKLTPALATAIETVRSIGYRLNPTLLPHSN